MIEYKMVEIQHSGIVLESLNVQPPIRVELTIYGHAWTFRFYIETPYGNMWFSNSNRLNTIISNLDNPEIVAFVRSVSILSNASKKLLDIEDIARHLEDKEEYITLFGKLAKSVYLSFIQKLYRYWESEYYDKNKDGMYLAHLEALQNLAKYSTEANKWKSRLENLNVEEMLQQHKLKVLAKKIGRK